MAEVDMLPHCRSFEIARGVPELGTGVMMVMKRVTVALASCLRRGNGKCSETPPTPQYLLDGCCAAIN